MESRIRSLTAHIVSAYIANNDLSENQLPSLIRNVYQALATIGPTPAEPVKAKHSMMMKETVFADHILCIDCGEGSKTLNRPFRPITR